jgi:hypothetical protein
MTMMMFLFCFVLFCHPSLFQVIMTRQSKFGWAAHIQVLFLLLVLTASCYAHGHDHSHDHHAVLSSSLSIINRRPTPPSLLSATMMTTLSLQGGSSSSSWGTRTPSLNPQRPSGSMQITTAAPVKKEPPAHVQTQAATKEDTKEMIDVFMTRDSRNSFICKSTSICLAWPTRLPAQERVTWFGSMH